MTIDGGEYCSYCSDENGQLIAFDEALTRFMQFLRQRDARLSPEEARAQTLDFMSKMPAWKAHPELAAARAQDS